MRHQYYLLSVFLLLIGCAKIYGPLDVPASTSIFRVDETAHPFGDNAVEITLPKIALLSSEVEVELLEISGMISCCNHDWMHGADGWTYYSNTDLDIRNDGLARIAHKRRTMFLSGLFVKGAPLRVRNRQMEPPALVYHGLTRDLEERPQLNQIFFIGDGWTGDSGKRGVHRVGQRQKFYAPKGATHLLLGFADGGAFKFPPNEHDYDNPGKLIATVRLKWKP